jgi:hypothetical protein
LLPCEWEEVPVRFAFRDFDDHAAYAPDTGGPAALALRGLPEDEREAQGSAAWTGGAY